MESRSVRMPCGSDCELRGRLSGRRLGQMGRPSSVQQPKKRESPRSAFRQHSLGPRSARGARPNPGMTGRAGSHSLVGTGLCIRPAAADHGCVKPNDVVAIPSLVSTRADHPRIDFWAICFDTLLHVGVAEACRTKVICRPVCSPRRLVGPSSPPRSFSRPGDLSIPVRRHPKPVGQFDCSSGQDDEVTDGGRGSLIHSQVMQPLNVRSLQER
jgi:hypothetical protein